MIGYTEVSDGSTGCLIVVNAVVTNYILVVVSPRYYKHWPAIGPDNYQSSSSEANYLCSSWGLVSSKFWLTMLWKEEGRKSMADWSTRRRDTHNMLLYSIKTYSYQRLWDKMPSVPYKKKQTLSWTSSEPVWLTGGQQGDKTTVRLTNQISDKQSWETEINGANLQIFCLNWKIELSVQKYKNIWGKDPSFPSYTLKIYLQKNKLVWSSGHCTL